MPRSGSRAGQAIRLKLPSFDAAANTMQWLLAFFRARLTFRLLSSKPKDIFIKSTPCSTAQAMAYILMSSLPWRQITIKENIPGQQWLVVGAGASLSLVHQYIFGQCRLQIEVPVVE